MRIIAGKYRGRKLKSPPSLETRPTSDRLRETLFNILAPRIEGARFLDLCAGSGAVGIEALSRGAQHITFVDRSQKMRAVIEANLESLEVDQSEIEIVTADAADLLRRVAKKKGEAFDIIFFDPPYLTDYHRVMDYVGEHLEQLLSKHGVVIVEHHKKTQLPVEFSALRRYRALKQGDSILSFYEVT